MIGALVIACVLVAVSGEGYQGQQPYNPVYNPAALISKVVAINLHNHRLRKYGYNPYKQPSYYQPASGHAPHYQPQAHQSQYQPLAHQSQYQPQGYKPSPAQLLTNVVGQQLYKHRQKKYGTRYSPYNTGYNPSHNVGYKPSHNVGYKPSPNVGYKPYVPVHKPTYPVHTPSSYNAKPYQPTGHGSYVPPVEPSQHVAYDQRYPANYNANQKPTYLNPVYKGGIQKYSGDDSYENDYHNDGNVYL